MYRILEQGKAFSLNDLPRGENMTNFSILNDLSQPLVFRSFSIKYVFQGCENYLVNGNRYNVHAGEYLLANTYCEGNIDIDSNQVVKGICIDVSPALLSEVFANFLTPKSPLQDLMTFDFFSSEQFIENKYHVANTRLGKALSSMSLHLNAHQYRELDLSNAFYYTLAEDIIEDHRHVISQLYNITTVKHHTRKDLYRRLCKGKEFLDNNYDVQCSIGTAARYATLSEYHFFRLFKSAFSITPQQYLIQLRLSKSNELLTSGNYSVTEAALAVGFSDIFGFSKSFKKFFGHSPSLVTGSSVQ